MWWQCPTLVGSCVGRFVLRTSSDAVFFFQFGVAFWWVVLGEVYFEGANRVWRALKTLILNTGGAHDPTGQYIHYSHHPSASPTRCCCDRPGHGGRLFLNCRHEKSSCLCGSFIPLVVMLLLMKWNWFWSPGSQHNVLFFGCSLLPICLHKFKGWFRANFEFGEKVHQWRVSREWSNVIGHKMVSSLAGVDTTAKVFSVKNFKHGWNMTWRHCLMGEFSKSWVFWAVFSFLFFHYVHQTNCCLSNNLVLGWNSWPIDALLCSLNWSYDNAHTRTNH